MPYVDVEYHTQYRKDRIARNRAWLIAYKESHPCTDCGNFFPYYVMQFDHLKDKYLGIARMWAHSLERIEQEIAKCELVCANCHAIRTHKRRSGV